MFLKKQIIGAMSMMVAVVHSVTLSACTPHSVREAESVVIQADSLWHEGKMYGVDMGDSATLAQAYETLRKHSAFSRQCAEVCPFVRSTSSLRTYSHSCYHYGKLLRAKDDPVSAMQVFIDATHSQTDDYHILGRVYSNMGDICHLAGEFPLSYDMFEKSANMFLQNGDTLNYYYGLNEMAFELAEQGKKEETMHLLAKIEENYRNAKIVAQNLRAKAILYREIEQYDSVLCTIDSLHTLGIEDITGYVLKAQSFWFIGKKDSALSCAKYVMTLPKASSQDRHNMIYILLNCDSTLHAEEIKSLSAQRADIEVQVLIPLHKKYAVAVSGLQQDLQRKPFYIYFIPISAFLTLLIIGLYIYAKRIHKEKSRQLDVLHTVQQQRFLHIRHKQNELERACTVIRNAEDWQIEIHWKDYTLMCKYIDEHLDFLAQKLQEYNVLNEKEVRLCILVFIGGFSDKQLADILCYGEKSIRGIKRYTAQKLGTRSANLRIFLLNMLTQEPIE